MDDDGGIQLAAAMDPSPMFSPDSASHQSAQQASAADTPTPASSSRMSTTFEFTSAPSDDSVHSFDPAIAAFADMAFSRPPLPAPHLRHKSSLPGAPQPDQFQRRDLHDKKRLKAEPETPALDSIVYWIQFDDDADKMGSFEIDYSKRNDPTGQTGAAAVTNTMPGLGSGLYSTPLAPFREDDFIDDAVFDQVLSDNEDMLDAANLGEQLADTKNPAAPPPPHPPPPLPEKSFHTVPLAWDAGRTLPGLRLNPAIEREMPKQTRRDVWGMLPRGTNQTLSPDEQRRLLEIALNTGQMPGSFIPPNGFGIGFGAGLGARPPAEFERREGPSSASRTGRQSTYVGASKADEKWDRAQNPQPKRAAGASSGSIKRGAGLSTETGKPKSADRVAHNDVERKYRTNLKVKIAELRDAVPALQSPPLEADPEGGHQGAPKVSKGTVLTKATEYIQQLEQQNRAIMLEHQQLTRRLQAFETLFNSASASRHTDLMPNHSMTLFDPRGFC